MVDSAKYFFYYFLNYLSSNVEPLIRTRLELYWTELLQTAPFDIVHAWFPSFAISSFNLFWEHKRLIKEQKGMTTLEEKQIQKDCFIELPLWRSCRSLILSLTRRKARGFMSVTKCACMRVCIWVKEEQVISHDWVEHIGQGHTVGLSWTQKLNIVSIFTWLQVLRCLSSYQRNSCNSAWACWLIPLIAHYMRHKESFASHVFAQSFSFLFMKQANKHSFTSLSVESVLPFFFFFRSVWLLLQWSLMLVCYQRLPLWFWKFTFGFKQIHPLLCLNIYHCLHNEQSSPRRYLWAWRKQVCKSLVGLYPHFLSFYSVWHHKTNSALDCPQNKTFISWLLFAGTSSSQFRNFINSLYQESTSLCQNP